MRVIITRRMLPLIIQGATPAEVAAIAQALGAGVAFGQCDGGAVKAGTAQDVRMSPAKPLKAGGYAPTFGLTAEGAAAVRKRRQRRSRGGGRVTVGRLDGQPELPMDVPGAASTSSIATDSSRQLSTAIESSAAAPAKTTGHGGQATHPPAPESLVQLMRLLVSRYTVDELAQKIPLDVAQVIRMRRGKRGTSPKTLRQLIWLAQKAELLPPNVQTDRLISDCWVGVRSRAHHLPKSWK